MRLPFIDLFTKKAEENARTAAREEVARALTNAFDFPKPDRDRGIYAFDFPWQYTVPQSPRRKPGAIIDAGTLRHIADVYDVARSCINHLKREVATVPIEVVARRSSDDTPEVRKRIEEATAWLDSMNGGVGGFGRRRNHFEAAVIEDLLVVGAAAIHLRRTVGGGISEVVAIDSATIRPVVDAYGFQGSIAYQQWVQGIPMAEFAPEEMVYDGLYPRSWTPYFASPLEFLLSPIMSAIKADEWNRMWITEGNTPSDMLALPDDWTPSQVREFAEYFDSVLAANTQQRQRTKFVPGGTARVGNPTRKDQDFQEFELWLMKRCCSIFGVQPASIGFADLQYKTSQKNSVDQTSMYGAGTILQWRKDLYDELLSQNGFPELEVKNVLAWEEDAGQRADRLVKLVDKGVLTINEARKEIGLDPREGGDATNSETTPVGKPSGNMSPNAPADEARAALSQWEKKALRRMKDGRRAACAFESEAIPHLLQAFVRAALEDCATPDEIKRLFAFVRSAQRERDA